MLFQKRKPTYDFLGIGDSGLDVFLTIDEATLSCNLNHEHCQLCLAYGDKVPVQSVTRVPGAGNSSNVAIGASRLGLKSAIYSIVGQDTSGTDIVRQWGAEKVSTEYVAIDLKHETNYHTVLHYKDDRTILIYHQPRIYHLPKLRPVRWIYYTSIGHGHEHLEQELLRHLDQFPDQQLLFQPGTFQLRRGLEAITPVIKHSHIFAVNKEEAQLLLNTTSDHLPDLILPFIHLGARVVIITDGPNGSYASDGTALWFCPIFPGVVIERTGAGDSYTLGFMYGLDKTLSIAEAMRYGTANSWSVVQYIGPQAGLLTKRAMEQTLQRFKRIQPKRLKLFPKQPKKAKTSKRKTK